MKNLPSLRNRAILFSIIVGTLVLLVSIIGYWNQKQTHAQASEQIYKREQLIGMLYEMRVSILGLYSGVNNYLIVPEKQGYKDQITSNFNRASIISKELLTNDWVINNEQDQLILEWRALLETLQSNVSDLLSIRVNVTRQYPSLAVGNDVLQPNRNKLNNEIAVVMNEMFMDSTQTRNPNVYGVMIQTRHLWTQMLSNFRLYLANRVGSFNESALVTQEKSINTMYKELQVQVARLIEFGNKGKLGFESQDAVNNIKKYLQKWHQGFKRVVEIHHSGEWRNDVKIMKETIAPGVDLLISKLAILETFINASVADDITVYEKIVQQQNRVLWGVAILGVIFIIGVIMSFDRLVFSPISVVISALKSEALGKQGNVMPQVNSRESQDLINAFSEMSRQVRLRQRELEYRALHDSLTSLPNRTLLFDRLEHDLYIAKRSANNLSMLMIDLDRFKEVNDTLGHSVGDSLLISVGNRITSSLRDVDTVARIGGDEYAILLPNTNEEQALALAQKLTAALKEEFIIEGVSLYISASIGICVYPIHGLDSDTLMRYADIAMYIAKRNKTGFEVYSSDEDEYSMSRLNLTNDLRDAIENNEMDVYYQPILDIQANKIIAIEALSRWIHPKYGMISPEQFIPLAEQAGLINKLTYQLMNKVMDRTKQWHLQGHKINAAVNISAHSFSDQDFLSEIRTALHKSDLPAEYLTLEITEGAMMTNPVQAIDILTLLREMEVSIAIDDFGTGFSSMAYLKQLPVTELKIDKSFVIGVDNDKSNEAIVRSIIELAHNLDLRVIAEGIENKRVWEMLSEFSCNAGQGFYMYRPMSAEDLSLILNRS